MSEEPAPRPRRPIPPLMDRLGELCRDGKEAAEFLWQVPDDQKTRHKIPGMLAEIQELAQKQRAQGGTPGPGRRGEACCVTGGRLGAKRTAAWSFATTGRQFCFR